MFSKKIILLSAFILTLTHSTPGYSQNYDNVYDDYDGFSTEPKDIDDEVKQLFGRFFQYTIHLGASVFTGDLGKAYPAGFMGGLKFIFYFNPVWAAEIGGYYGQNKGRYNTDIGGAPIDFFVEQTLIPLHLGIRYGFNPKTISRGLSTLNPYIAANFEVILRNETVEDNPPALPSGLPAQFSPGAKTNSTAFGVNLGGGVEFDVYKDIVLLGVDFRYHLIFWPDSSTKVGQLERSGDYMTLMANLTYNY